ncbi:MAG: carbohydrate ABC transporter permease [Christensenellales bacterium]|jgi:raffinose/stachyose/melibiose transport system permease protein
MQRTTGLQGKKKRKTPWSAYLYVLPMVVLMGVFIYYPILVNFYYTLHNFSAFSRSYDFIGLGNIKLLLSDPVIATALRNNIYYCLVSIIFQVLLALGLAFILEEPIYRRFSTVLRTTYFIPVLISITVVAMLFMQILSPRGLLNSFLSLFGKRVRTGWLGRSSSAIFCAIFMSQWHSLGYTTMLFIVDIQKIPTELLEAAEIYGANRAQRFFKIVVPLVREMFFVVMVTTVSGAFLVFNDVYVLTRGGPGNSSTTLAVYMYDMAFTQDRMGYASTIAILMFLICVGLAMLQRHLLKTGKG